MANFVTPFEKWGRRRCHFRPSWHYYVYCIEFKELSLYDVIVVLWMTEYCTSSSVQTQMLHLKGVSIKNVFHSLKEITKAPSEAGGRLRRLWTPLPRLIKENRKRGGQSITVSQPWFKIPTRPLKHNKLHQKKIFLHAIFVIKGFY